MTVARGLPRMKIMNRVPAITRRLALAAALACLALPAVPQTPNTYTVEIVVFRNGGDGAAVPAGQAPPPVAGDEVSMTPVTTRKLGANATRLSRGGMRVLGHVAWSQSPTGFDSNRGVSAARLGLASMTGKVVFERGEYLHLGVDLWVEDAGRLYHINELRKQVKPDDVHYFDHPAIGVLAVITRD